MMEADECELNDLFQTPALSVFEFEEEVSDVPCAN
jgi:hypothetical protein